MRPRDSLPDCPVYGCRCDKVASLPLCAQHWSRLPRHWRHAILTARYKRAFDNYVLLICDAVNLLNSEQEPQSPGGRDVKEDGG